MVTILLKLELSKHERRYATGQLELLTTRLLPILQTRFKKHISTDFGNEITHACPAISKHKTKLAVTIGA